MKGTLEAVLSKCSYIHKSTSSRLNNSNNSQQFNNVHYKHSFQSDIYNNKYNVPNNYPHNHAYDKNTYNHTYITTYDDTYEINDEYDNNHNNRKKSAAPMVQLTNAQVELFKQQAFNMGSTGLRGERF